MPFEAPITEHLDKVADAVYRCSGQETFSKLYYIMHYNNMCFNIYILMYVQARAPAYECEFMFSGEHE